MYLSNYPFQIFPILLGQLAINHYQKPGGIARTRSRQKSGSTLVKSSMAVSPQWSPLRTSWNLKPRAMLSHGKLWIHFFSNHAVFFPLCWTICWCCWSGVTLSKFQWILAFYTFHQISPHVFSYNVFSVTTCTSSLRGKSMSIFDARNN